MGRGGGGQKIPHTYARAHAHIHIPARTLNHTQSTPITTSPYLVTHNLYPFDPHFFSSPTLFSSPPSFPSPHSSPSRQIFASMPSLSALYFKGNDAVQNIRHYRKTLITQVRKERRRDCLLCYLCAVCAHHAGENISYSSKDFRVSSRKPSHTHTLVTLTPSHTATFPHNFTLNLGIWFLTPPHCP